MKGIEYNSTFDPDEFEDPPFLEPPEIKLAIKEGKFKKKNLKRKKRKFNHRDNDLDIISEESSEEEDD